MRNILFIGVFIKSSQPPPVNPNDPNAKPPTALQLCGEEDLSDFRWYKGTIREFMLMYAGAFAQRVEPGTPYAIPQEVQTEKYNFHVFCRSEGVAAVTVARDSYPDLVAHSLNRKVLDTFLAKYPVSSLKGHTASSPQFALSELKEYIITYQDPNKADSISRIQQELGETRQVLHKTIEQVLERGEKIDSLVAKSDSLSSQSKMFYTQAKKQNSCCSVM
ncbi:palmitoyltransferase [Paecilomyces lecythidis]|uniref:Palmitoyltransferase n=1 Tax=Paecilomyces lecythidis TaxID=3004212 RepID=A0ABR3XZZ4_9EURO